MGVIQSRNFDIQFVTSDPISNISVTFEIQDDFYEKADKFSKLLNTIETSGIKKRYTQTGEEVQMVWICTSISHPCPVIIHDLWAMMRHQKENLPRLRNLVNVGIEIWVDRIPELTDNEKSQTKAEVADIFNYVTGEPFIDVETIMIDID